MHITPVLHLLHQLMGYFCGNKTLEAYRNMFPWLVEAPSPQGHPDLPFMWYHLSSHWASPPSRSLMHQQGLHVFVCSLTLMLYNSHPFLLDLFGLCGTMGDLRQQTKISETTATEIATTLPGRNQKLAQVYGDIICDIQSKAYMLSCKLILSLFLIYETVSHEGEKSENHSDTKD